MSDTVLECDLVVIGAGMAGLSAAGWAAQHGARVVVIEKGRQPGGSAALSTGMLWTATSPELMRLYARGRDDLAAVIMEEYPRAMEWLRTRGIEMTTAVNVPDGRGYQIDILRFLKDCESSVTQYGGYVVTETVTEKLLPGADGGVAGVRTLQDEGPIDVHARWTLLATGGYPGSADLRARFIHENARDLPLRASPNNVGDGLRLAMEVGADVPGTNPGFYGHLVSESRHWGDPRLYTMLSQFHSDHCALFNTEGVRYCDESLGDHINTNHTAHQKGARALCFWDSRVQSNYATQTIARTQVPIDRIAVALEHGGKGVAGATLDEIGDFAAAEGFDGKRLVYSILDYNKKIANNWEGLHPRRSTKGEPLDRAPFYALIVRPGITSTHGGIQIDANAQALRPDRTPIPGLLAAGADAGDAYGIGYAGGLALSMTFGMRAAKTAGWQ